MPSTTKTNCPGPFSGQFPKISGIAMNQLESKSYQWGIIDGLSTIRKTKPRRIEWRRCFPLFNEVWTAVYLLDFYHGKLLSKESDKTPVAIPRFLLRKEKNVIWFAVALSSLWCFCHSLFLIGNSLLWLIHHDSLNLRNRPEEGLEIVDVHYSSAKICLVKIGNINIRYIKSWNIELLRTSTSRVFATYQIP